MLFLAASTLDSIFPGFASTNLMIVITAATAVTLVAWIVIAASALIRGRWMIACRYAVGTLVVPILLMVSFRLGDYVHLLLYYPHYMSIINARDEPLQTIRFEWGDSSAFVTDGMVLNTLVYDTGGRLRSYVSERREGRVGGIYTRHLLGDFYLETEISNN